MKEDVSNYQIENEIIMNNRIIKSCLYLPLIWFSVYLILILIGAMAFLLGAPDQFYCSIYCKIGIWALIVSSGVYISYQAVKYIKGCQQEKMQGGID